MHYGGRAFSQNGMNTITTKNPSDQMKIGNRKGLSFNDLWLAHVIYPCDDGCSKSCPRNSFLGKGCKCYCLTNDRRKGCDETVAPINKPSVTSKPLVEECSNMHKHCDYWANLESKNYCQTNPFVKANCKKACGKCGTVINCMDMSSFCERWAGKGYCQGTFGEYVGELCPRSCTGCQESEDFIESESESDGSKKTPSEYIVVLMLVAFTVIQMVLL